MRIDKKLNLVIPIETERGTAYLHATPVSYTVLEQFFRIISMAFSLLYKEGHSMAGGPRIAALLLRQVAQEQDCWDVPGMADSVKNGFFNEILRLCNVLVPVEGKGWQSLSYDSEPAREFLDLETRSKIEGILVFFTLALFMQSREQLPIIMDFVGGIYNFQTSSLSFMEYQSSLTTSTKAATTGESPPAIASSIPS